MSIQGEGCDSGRLCTFVRFSRCNIRCTYCDTDYAFKGGRDLEPDAIVAEVLSHQAPLVCLTGGEPMLQPKLPELMGMLLRAGKGVILETNGVIPLDAVPDSVVKVVDVKTPGAFRPQGQPAAAPVTPDITPPFHLPNLALLRHHDQVKFVICDEDDYLWSRSFIEMHALTTRVQNILISPSHGVVNPQDVVTWMKRDHLPARLNLQLHKYVWGPEAQGV